MINALIYIYLSVLIRFYLISLVYGKIQTNNFVVQLSKIGPKIPRHLCMAGIKRKINHSSFQRCKKFKITITNKTNGKNVHTLLIEDQLSPNCMPCTNAWEFLDQFLKAEQQNYLFVSFDKNVLLCTRLYKCALNLEIRSLSGALKGDKNAEMPITANQNGCENCRSRRAKNLSN
jgi:hypothetical protein